MANISVRMSATVEKYLDGTSNKSAVANTAIESWIACEREARRDLKGLLTVDELLAFIDVASDCIVEISNADTFLRSFQDACNFLKLEEKWNINGQKVTQKVTGLSIAHWIVLYQWSSGYWDNPEQDAKEYAALLA